MISQVAKWMESQVMSAGCLEEWGEKDPGRMSQSVWEYQELKILPSETQPEFSVPEQRDTSVWPTPSLPGPPHPYLILMYKTNRHNNVKSCAAIMLKNDETDTMPLQHKPTFSYLWPNIKQKYRTHWLSTLISRYKLCYLPLVIVSSFSI